MNAELRGEDGPQFVDVDPPLPTSIRWECLAGNVLVTKNGVEIYFTGNNPGTMRPPFSLANFEKLQRIVATARAVYEDGAKVTSPRDEVPF